MAQTEKCMLQCASLLLIQLRYANYLLSLLPGHNHECLPFFFFSFPWAFPAEQMPHSILLVSLGSLYPGNVPSHPLARPQHNGLLEMGMEDKVLTIGVGGETLWHVISLNWCAPSHKMSCQPQWDPAAPSTVSGSCAYQVSGQHCQRSRRRRISMLVDYGWGRNPAKVFTPTNPTHSFSSPEGLQTSAEPSFEGDMEQGKHYLCLRPYFLGMVGHLPANGK